MNASVTESVESRAVVSASALFSVYVHAPSLATAIEPYVPVASPVYVKAESSASVALIVPVAVVAVASSVTAPTAFEPASGASLAPVTVIVTVIVSEASPSETVIVNASVTESPESRAVVSASALFSVYVHAPLFATAIEPYVPVASPLYARDESASASVALIVPVAVVEVASSVTAPVWSAPAETASSAPVTVIVTVMVSEAVPSETVIVNTSVTVSSASRAVVSASALFSVYVQAPALVTAIAPYVPVASPVYVNDVPVSTSVGLIDPVAVVPVASSVTAPTALDPASGASLAPVIVTVIV